MTLEIVILIMLLHVALSLTLRRRFQLFFFLVSITGFKIHLDLGHGLGSFIYCVALV